MTGSLPGKPRRLWPNWTANAFGVVGKYRMLRPNASIGQGKTGISHTNRAGLVERL
jgi:hypothetical protein